MRDVDRYWEKRHEQHDRMGKAIAILVIVGWLISVMMITAIMTLAVLVATHFVWGWP